MCRRFSAWSKTAEAVPSMTESVTSSPRWAGRQCRKHTSGLAWASSSSLTWYGPRSCRRTSTSASRPIDVHTSV